MMLKLKRRRFLIVLGCSFLAAGASALDQPTMSTAELLDMLARYPRDGGLMIQLRQALSDEKDTAILPRALAIYSLGCLTMGREEAGISAREVLLRRFPDSEYAAMVEMDALGSACPSCSGEGRIGSACAECGGSGSCSMCDGRGSITHQLQAMEVSCPQCGGAGQCSRCLGAGERFRLCNRCGGRGVILEMSKVRSAYGRALVGLTAPGTPQDEADPDADQPAVSAPVRRPPRDPSTWDEDVIRFF
jgi:hypothetical protein